MLLNSSPTRSSRVIVCFEQDKARDAAKDWRSIPPFLSNAPSVSTSCKLAFKRLRVAHSTWNFVLALVCRSRSTEMHFVTLQA